MITMATAMLTVLLVPTVLLLRLRGLRLGGILFLMARRRVDGRGIRVAVVVVVGAH
ncbi:hypothetical protein ADILRU_0550 [Leifsonia rubra CMS 76R]|nr:hypothetical protein ADILRU_0550 [Leifsonia rubra CMS 76R]